MPPTFCPCNKPILKRPSAPPAIALPPTTADEDSFGLLHIDPSVLGQPTVRFPPTPALVTRTFLAHPSTEYDRTPIVVAPNACKLPARGCPGRTYLPSSPSSSPSRSGSSHSHSNSNYNGQERERGRRGRGRSPATRRTHASSTTGVALPPLVPDLTSSSSDDDDSDRVPNPFIDIDTYTSLPAHSKSKNTIDDHSDEVDRAFARFRSSQVYHGTDDALSIPPTPTPKPTLVAPSPSLSLSRHSHSHTTTHSHSPSLNLTLSDSPPPVPSPLSNPTSPVSFNMRPATSTSLSSSAHSTSTSSMSSSPRASRWERAVRRNGNSGERERSSERRSRRKEREGKESKEGRESKEGFKRFGDFEGRSVLSGCSLRVDDGGCFGGF